ncbi:MAG: creatininase family protein [Chloroflexota bacterium]|nr:creatininase family protein [Chloroflexota bacterium]
MGTENREGAPLDLAHATWIEAGAAMTPGAIVLLPIGAIEAHGPHLPLDTDVIIAVETAHRAAARLSAQGESVILAPAIRYGVSYVGTCFAGTVPAPADVITGLVTAVLSHLAASGPRRLAVVNAHLEPAHVAALQAGVDAAIMGTGARIAFPDKRQDRWAATLSEEFRRGARHAGSYETSLVLAAPPIRYGPTSCPPSRRFGQISPVASVMGHERSPKPAARRGIAVTRQRPQLPRASDCSTRW